MTIQHRKRAYLAVFIILALLFVSCCASAHMAEHTCSYYDGCSICQFFSAGCRLSVFMLAFFSGCALLRACLRVEISSARSGFAPATLVSSFVQLND